MPEKEVLEEMGPVDIERIAKRIGDGHVNLWFESRLREPRFLLVVRSCVENPPSVSIVLEEAGFGISSQAGVPKDVFVKKVQSLGDFRINLQKAIDIAKAGIRMVENHQEKLENDFVKFQNEWNQSLKD